MIHEIRRDEECSDRPLPLNEDTKRCVTCGAGSLPVMCVNERAAAECLSVSVHTLRAWRRRGRGPRYVKVAGAGRPGRGLSGRVMYRVVDLIAFLEATTVPTELPNLPE